MAVDYTDKTDYELVLACIDGDKACFNELLMRYKNLVYSVVLRMVSDREQANDLAQDVFIKIYRNLEKYSPEYRFSTWTIRIATNHVIDYRRRSKQETLNIDDIDEGAYSGESPEAAYIAKEQSQMLVDMIESLPDMYKVPIVLYHQQGLSYQEISEITDEPLSKVKNRIFRGRKILKEKLKESMFDVRRGESYGM